MEVNDFLNKFSLYIRALCLTCFSSHLFQAIIDFYAEKKAIKFHYTHADGYNRIQIITFDMKFNGKIHHSNINLDKPNIVAFIWLDLHQTPS